ncbi:hypothetical protein RchiOBHm_Chr5g0045231 [Rosa chinensis]|uniref:Uncharacterized protein n=1 Tax=Rosa chinensis TaxID=74649 RepID=A0A2P6QDS1_ROSCH|nr:hypothetical protein RchiOBHm_Chr5g0045231 [Rosa chinensis]
MQVGSSVVELKPLVPRICVMIALNHTHSRTASCRAMISEWFEEVATRVCLVDLQDIAMFPMVNT